jgi:hypothetical protein
MKVSLSMPWLLAFAALMTLLPVHGEPVPFAKYVLGPPNLAGRSLGGKADPRIQNGMALRELFENPDQWKEARKLTDAILYADWAFEAFTDEELTRWFGMMKEWGIKLELEVGALKDWGKTGRGTFEKQQEYWDRITRLGGEIAAISFDEPVVCARRHLAKIAPNFKGTPEEYAVQETVDFMELVRKKYPRALLGNITAHPSETADQNIAFIEAVHQKLAERGVRGFDFYRVDPNWINYNVRPQQGNWQDVRRLEDYCKKIGLPFSMIYWSPHDSMARRNGVHDDSTWYTDVMTQGYMYLSVGGQPDQYVIESWVDSPIRAIPETDEFTFTRSALDFGRKFAKPKERIPPNYLHDVSCNSAGLDNKAP